MVSGQTKAKLFGVAAFFISALGFVGLGLQSSSAEAPGQVGASPRCDVVVNGAPARAFDIADNTGSVTFNVTGPKTCKVQVSTASFYAPSMDGRPYEKQELFKRNTRILTPGEHTMKIAVPTKSTPAKGCFYQLDLTYGVRNVMPILAYAHGRIDGCGEPKPTYTCTNLSKEKIDRDTVRLVAKAATTGDAKVTGYRFDLGDGTVKDSNDTTIRHTYSKPGEYTVKATALVRTNGTATETAPSVECTKVVTVAAEPVKPTHPAIAITKYVNSLKHTVVKQGEEFTYQLKVTNTGDVDLQNVIVSDGAPTGVQFTSVTSGYGVITENTKWQYTAPLLKQGQSLSINIRAKVMSQVAGLIKNTACTDAPAVPAMAPTTTADACDSATVELAQPKQVTVCDSKTGEIKSVLETDKTNYRPESDPACKPVQVCDTTKKVIVTVPRALATNYASENDIACKPVTPVTPPTLTGTNTNNNSSSSNATANVTVNTPPAAAPAPQPAETTTATSSEKGAPQSIASTGPQTVVSGLLGSSAIGYGAYSFAASRRNLLEKLLNR